MGQSFVCFSTLSFDTTGVSQIETDVHTKTLLGVADDGPSDLEYVTSKMLQVRVFPDGEGQPWQANVADIDGEVLCGKACSTCVQ